MKTKLEDNLILNKKQVMQKVIRMAFEIYENNYKEKRLVIAGISGEGFTLARLLVRELKKISPFELVLVKVDINKEDPTDKDIKINCDLKTLNRSCLILVDDVLNTGRIFLHSLKPFLNIDVKKIQTAVLVNRRHKLFPISADYTGYELSTTLNDHIQVTLSKEQFGVYLY